MALKSKKTGKCSHCGKPGASFSPPGKLRKFCDMDCCIAFAKEKSQKDKTKKLKKEFNDKDKSYWLKHAQISVNRWVRWRDRKKPCVSCGRKSGCKVNAGHYKTVGSNSALRFNPLNIHAQCEYCNNYLSGNIMGYTPELIKRIGKKRYEFIINHPRTRKWSIDELKQIKEKYDRKYKNARLINE